MVLIWFNLEFGNLLPCFCLVPDGLLYIDVSGDIARTFHLLIALSTTGAWSRSMHLYMSVCLWHVYQYCFCKYFSDGHNATRLWVHLHMVESLLFYPKIFEEKQEGASCSVDSGPTSSSFVSLLLLLPIDLSGQNHTISWFLLGTRPITLALSHPLRCFFAMLQN